MAESHFAGDTIRFIREAKGYTQKYVSESIIRQSTYSKVERGESDPASSKFFTLLDRLEMSVEEFLFIQHGYAHTKKGALIHAFTNQNYNNPEKLNLLRNQATEYAEESGDRAAKDIASICNALIELSDSNDVKKARKYVEPVWERLESFDQWFLTELYLVNNILFFFPTESAIHITKRAVEQLKKYRGFKASNQLRFNFQFNLTYLLLHNGAFDEALILLEELISDAKKLKYHDMLAICYERKGIALIKTGNLNGRKLIEKGLTMLEIIEEIDLKKQAEKEIEKLMD